MTSGLAKAFLGLVLGVFLCATAAAADLELAPDSTLEGILRRGTLRVGFEAGFMPFEMIDKRGGLRERNPRAGDVRRGAQRTSVIGFDIDIAREMAADLGVRFVPVHTQWTSIIPALKVGRFDIIISGMSVTPERQRQVDFAAPYMTIGQTILLNARHEGTVESYEDLNDARYVVTSKPGTTGEQAVMKFLPKATYKPFDTETAGAMEVLNGDADAFVYDLPFNAVFHAMHGAGKAVFLDRPFTTEPLAWAIRKDDPDFARWLNKFLATIQADGRFQRIHDKWFASTDWFKYVR